tara:strand:- start:7390 stop:7677 length:288 start_codon:yes stop_codon:yes gene_type:complete
MIMSEIEKSFERIQRRRMVLTVVGNSGSGYDLRDREQCVFYFGDGQFILRPITVRTGNCEEDCTAIHMGGSGDNWFVVLEDIETINEFLFGVTNA